MTATATATEKKRVTANSSRGLSVARTVKYPSPTIANPTEGSRLMVSTLTTVDNPISYSAPVDRETNSAASGSAPACAKGVILLAKTIHMYISTVRTRACG